MASGHLHFEPENLRPIGPWVLVRQDPDPERTEGGLFIPATSRIKGRRMVKATVVRSGSGRGKGVLDDEVKKGRGRRYEMPKPGDRVVYPVVAAMPDTQKLIQFYGKEGHFLVHAIDLLGVMEGDGEEPRVE